MQAFAVNADDPAASLARIRELIQHAVDAGTIPGAVAHISHRGNTLMFDACGLADI